MFFANLSIICVLLANLVFSQVCWAETYDKIVAVVGREVITKSELETALRSRKNLSSFKDSTLPKKNAAEQATLNILIDDLLLKQTLDEANIVISEQDIAKAINNILQQNHLSFEQLKTELTRNGTSYETYKKQLERDIRQVRFMQQVIQPRIKISDQDLKDYYEQHQEEFRGVNQVHLAQISFPLDKLSSQEQFEQLVKKATEINKQAVAHPQQFAELAKNNSQDSFAAQGGDLGLINTKDLAPEVTVAVSQLKPGEVSRPILTQQAVVMVKLLGYPELSGKDFDKLRDSIYNKMFDERAQTELQSYLAKQRQRTFIDIR